MNGTGSAVHRELAAELGLTGRDAATRSPGHPVRSHRVLGTAGERPDPEAAD